jgi:pimeloyl-ACP methyl ester carboxylesterase
MNHAAEAMPAWAREAAQVPNRAACIEVDGTPIRYLAWGDPQRPTVVLVHGTAAHAEWWRFIAPLLLPDYHVVALDLGGMGDSGHRSSYARDDFINQVIAVTRHVAPDRPAYVVGHSLGGFVTIQAGYRAGKDLGGIIVIDSPIHAPGTEPDRAWKLRADTPNTVYPDRADAIAHFRLIPEQPCENAFVFNHISAHSVKEVAGGWSWKFDPGAFAPLTRRSYVDELLSMPCPVALFWGQRSRLFTPEVKSYMREAFGAKIPLVEIPDAYHHVLLDQPIALAAAIRAQVANWRCTNGKD